MMMLFLLLMLIILLSQDNVILLHLKSLQEQFAFYPSTCVLKYSLDVFPLLEHVTHSQQLSDYFHQALFNALFLIDNLYFSNHIYL